MGLAEDGLLRLDVDGDMVLHALTNRDCTDYFWIILRLFFVTLHNNSILLWGSRNFNITAVTMPAKSRHDNCSLYSGLVRI